MSMIPSVPGASVFASFQGSATLAPLRHRVFLSIWLATLASSFGSLAQSVGASWLMLSLASSADMVALVQAAVSLPILLFSLAAGAIADIWDRRSVMLLAQSVMLAVSVALAVLAHAGLATPALLLAFTFALGTGAAFYGPPWQASVREQVPRPEIPAAVALNSLAFNIARALGPALGGVLVAAAGSEAAFLFNALSYVGLIVVLSRWRPPPVERRLPPESMGPAMVAGLRYASQSPPIRRVLVRSFAFGLCGSGIWALLPLVASDLVRGGPLVYGMLLGGFGGGAIVGALASAPLRRRLGNEGLATAAVLVFGLAAAAIALAGAALPLLWLLVPVLVAAGTAWVLALSTFNVTVQMWSPGWVTGRAMAVYQMTTFGGLAGGSWIWGLIAEHGGGVALALGLSGVLMLATLALGRRFPLAAYEGLDLEPSGAWPEPEVTLEVEPKDGPVGVAVEYRVAVADGPAFLDAMRAVRRIRRRDGGRRWTLMQDVAEPERWIETFEVSTWLEHLRQHHRATRADEPASLRVRALHLGSWPPPVRHLLHRPLAAASVSRPPPGLDGRPAGPAGEGPAGEGPAA